MSHLDWRHHKLGSRPGKCITCHIPTIMRNAAEKPQHKVCAEQVADRDTKRIADKAQLLGTSS
jgi:hypothetical protein